MSLEHQAARKNLFWGLQCAGWAGAGVALFLTGLAQMPVEAALARNVLFTAYGFGVSLALRRGLRRMRRRGYSLPSVGIACLAVSLCAGTVAALLINVVTFSQIGLGETGLAWEQRFAGGLNFALVFLAWSLLYMAIRTYLELQAKREKALRADALAERMRLRSLRQQLRPHLLFNVLNTIASLIVEERNRDAYEMTIKVSQLLRSSLREETDRQVPLRQEIALARSYLDIEKVRFEDRLTIHWDLGRGIGAARVPRFLLQPLVENAVKHAASEQESGEITVRAFRRADTLRLEVEDDGPGFEKSEGRGEGGVGLRNTRARLSALFPCAHSLKIRSRTRGRGARVTIDLPFREADLAGAEALVENDSEAASRTSPPARRQPPSTTATEDL